MPRLRLYDIRLSRLPELIGKCQADVPSICKYVNSAQRRLLMCREAGDEGWWGTWAEVAFTNVSRSNPYLTLPREIARIQAVNVCNCPVNVHNQFYEYLSFGNGRLPKSANWRQCGCDTKTLTRNNAVTFVDPTVVPFKVRVYAASSNDYDAARRILIQGLDNSLTVVRTQDGLNRVDGEFLVYDDPFIDSTFQYNRLTGLQKDPTYGDIQIFQVDPTTGAERLLSSMAPSEMVAGYRRYYLNSLPASCSGDCGATNCEVTVTALVKLDLIPVQADTDYLLFHNIEAIIEECQSVRMSEIDNLKAQQMAAIHHLNAVRMLNSEVSHYLGKQSPAVSFAPFGTAHLTRQKIGALI